MMTFWLILCFIMVVSCDDYMWLTPNKTVSHTMATNDAFRFKINCTEEEVIHFTISSSTSILSGITTYIRKNQHPDFDDASQNDYVSHDLYFAVPAVKYISSINSLYYGILFFKGEDQRKDSQSFEIVASRKRPEYFSIPFNEHNNRLYYFQHRNTYLYFKFTLPPMHYASLTLWELEHPVYDNLYGIMEYIQFRNPASDEYAALKSLPQGNKPYVSLPAVYGNNTNSSIDVFYTMKYLDYTYQEYRLHSIMLPLPHAVQETPILEQFVNRTHGLYYHILVQPSESVIVQTTGVTYFNYISVKHRSTVKNTSLIFPTKIHHQGISDDLKHRYIYTNDAEDKDVHVLILVDPAPFSKFSSGSLNYVQIRHVNNTFSISFIGGIIAFVVLSSTCFFCYSLVKHHIHKILPKSSSHPDYALLPQPNLEEEEATLLEEPPVATFLTFEQPSQQ